VKRNSVNKTRIPAIATSTHTTFNFTTITCDFTHITTTSATFWHGKFNEAAFV